MLQQKRLRPIAFSFRNRVGVPFASAAAIALRSILFSAFGSLELIASFSSLTFLLVSIEVSLANLKLANEMHTAKSPVILGVGLMLVTIVLLVNYMAVHATSSLYFTNIAYVATAALFVLFRLLPSRQKQNT